MAAFERAVAFASGQNAKAAKQFTAYTGPGSGLSILSGQDPFRSPFNPGGPPVFPGGQFTPTTRPPGVSPGGLGDPCSLLPAILQSTCRAVGTRIGGEVAKRINPPTNGTPPRCPSGSVRVGNTCVAPGDAFPGGDPLFFPAGGEPVIGSFGIPAIRPASQQRNVLRCPRGAVLGSDDLCYMKGSIPKAFRKHVPATKPPMTAGDMKALRRIGTLQRKAKRLGTAAGLTCAPRKRR